MKRILIVWLSLFAFSAFAGDVVPKRSLKIVVASGALPQVKSAAQMVLASVRENPILAALSDGEPPSALTDSGTLSSAPASERAYSHLILIGTPDDPLVKAAWQHEAALEPGGFYIFGFGHLRGDVGYIESDRNPFLHSKLIKRLPFETEVITLSGATPAGVILATQSFLKHGIVNGVVAGQGWSRPDTSLLDRSPFSPEDPGPSTSEKIGDWTRLALTQASEDEYRGVLDDTGIKPQQIWRVKYFRRGVWDNEGPKGAFDNYSAGLHRRAYGNTLWVARFATNAEAQKAAPQIAAAAQIKRKGNIWTGKQPAYGSAQKDPPPDDITLWTRDACVFMSTLPAKSTELITGEGAISK